MRKHPLLLLILIIISVNLEAQLSAYYFSAGSGNYTPISGTVVNLASSELDEGTSGLKPIGFTFRYNGIDYTQLDICTNGFVQLGSTIDRNIGVISSNSLPYSSYRNVLAPLWDDLRVNSAGGIQYQTSGAAPNRIFTVQWSNMHWDYTSANPSVEFQLKLYETTNRIEFIYNQLSASVKDGEAVIGINVAGTGTGSFYMLTDASSNPSLNSDATRYYVINKKPATGQVYAFFVPMPCTGTPDGGDTKSSIDLVCAGTHFKLNVTGATLAQNLSYQWQSSLSGSNWQDIPAATDTNYIAQQSADTWYRRTITCGGITAYSSPVQIKTGVLPVQYASLPFTENFETSWLSNCGLRERPSLHFKNSVSTGNRSWRRDDDEAAGEWSTPYFNTWPWGNTTHAARFRVRDEMNLPVKTGDLDLYIDCSPAGSKELRFRHAQTIGAKSLSVWYSTDGGLNFTSLGDIPGWTLWKDQHFIIPSNSPTTIIRFRGKGIAYTSDSDIGIDDIQVQIMSCRYPDGIQLKSLSQTSATIAWNHEAGSAYEYKLTNVQDQIIGTIQTTSESQIQINTLDPANDYFFYVRRKCGNDTYSSWSMLALTPSMDCSVADVLNCNTPISFRIDDGSGRYDFALTDPGNSCSGTLNYGKEKLMRIVPLISGNYKLKITAITAQYPVSYYIKDASEGCAPYNWTCLGKTTTPTTFDLGNLSAGKEYFLLLDLYTIINGHNETIELICTGTNPDCVTGSITPAGPVAVCANESQLLQVSGGTAWQWFRNAAIINGANTNSYTPTQSGNYSVAVTNGSCTSVSNTVIVEIRAFTLPVVTFTGATTFCEGETLQLSTTAVSGYTYTWQKNGTAINNTNSENYTVSATGNYTVIANSAEGCSATSNAVSITVNARPAKPVITPGTATTFCEGNNVVLNSSASSGNQWYKDGVAVAGTQIYTATQSGNYSVITTENGCASETSATINVTVKALPPVPIITSAGNTLSSSASAGNQWYKDGTLLAGATGQSYTATASGVYTVQVTQNGCSATSAGFNFVFTGIVDPSAWGGEVSVYPNPLVSDLFVKNIRQRRLQLQLIDITGRPVFETQINGSKTISLPGIISGLYQLLITDLRKKETIVFRIIKL